MKYRFILASSMLMISFFSFSNTDIVQGPFKITLSDKVYFQTEADDDYPLALYILSDNKSKRIDTYETEGGKPAVQTVFFMTIDGKKNVIVLISWEQLHRAENINGNFFRVYGYVYEKNNLIVNKKINSDPNLSGQDGDFSGEQLFFKYKNAKAIKEYILKKYQ